jgi:hypothetical protein
MSSEQITQETVPVETTSTETTQPTATPSTVSNGDTPASWKSSISEEFRNDPNIEKFTEIDSLAKSYINATRMIGQDKVAVPNKNSTEDQWNEVYSKLGRPDTPDKYAFDIKSEVVTMDEGAIKSFAEQSHKLGLNNTQAQGILEFYKNNMESTMHQATIDTETAQAQSEAQLRQEWGKDFDGQVSRASALAKANMNPDVLDMKMQDGTRIGDHPEIIKGFAKIAGMLSEDKLISTESEGMNNIQNLQSEIAAITNNTDGPYWNNKHPDHEKMVQQVYTLREMAQPKEDR